ncbi:MAG TPA: FlgD immunoglobulin-like domain containing protein, partial [Candidatus Deferrimicrobium sp.]|nr:FlgD immunoglobulin-like domain containing protein [Candidatus Deferrimicrobium sp.]
VIDIIEHRGGVWFATGGGVNFSLDGGQTWLLYDATNGLVSDNISALFSIGQRIVVATNHGFGRDARSDGVSYSDDLGHTWQQVDFSPSGLNIPFVWGGNRTIYDITGYQDTRRGVDWLFFTAFAGGLLASQDNGESWRRVYASSADSFNFIWSHADPPADTLLERNRLFSCAADSSHRDTLLLWVGTAAGVFQYVYASPRVKPSSKHITAFAFCDQCADSSFIYLGGENGITRGRTTGPPFISRFESDGLPGPVISALMDFRGRLLAGTMDALETQSTGLAISLDSGNTFSAVPSFDEVIGPNRQITEFATIRERLYLAAEEAGVFVSQDSGSTWQHIFVDSSDTTSDNRRNIVHSLSALADTLRVGTDSGLVTLYFDSLGGVDSSRFHVFLENIRSSTMVMRVRTQLFYDSAGIVIDSMAIWTINRPLTDSGVAAVFISYGTDDTLFGSLLEGSVSYDLNFIADTVVVAGPQGARYRFGSGSFNTYPITGASDHFNNDVLTVMATRGDTIAFGSWRGFAISSNRGKSYSIYRVNTDSLAADVVINYTRFNTLRVDTLGKVYYPISGDWIVALGVQDMPNEASRIWVSCRPAHAGTNGISLGIVVPYDSAGQVVPRDSAVRFEREWESVYPDGFAWNFAFNGDSVFAATDGGLLFNHQDTGLTWDTIPLVDSLGVPLVLPGTPVYGVEVIDDHLWIGTGDRTMRLDLATLKVDLTFYVIDSTTPLDQVYAFPVPFSHSRDLGVDFHFTLDREADVTLDVYDYAMNLVTRVIDGQRFAEGIYPAAGSQRRTWDGRNDRGDPVAVGMYYFKVECSTGEVRWGKLAVIP